DLPRIEDSRIGLASGRAAHRRQGGACRCPPGRRARHSLRNAAAVSSAKLSDLQAVLQRAAIRLLAERRREAAATLISPALRRAYNRFFRNRLCAAEIFLSLFPGWLPPAHPTPLSKAASVRPFAPTPTATLSKPVSCTTMTWCGSPSIRISTAST